MLQDSQVSDTLILACEIGSHTVYFELNGRHQAHPFMLADVTHPNRQGNTILQERISWNNGQIKRLDPTESRSAGFESSGIGAKVPLAARRMITATIQAGLRTLH